MNLFHVLSLIALGFGLAGCSGEGSAELKVAEPLPPPDLPAVTVPSTPTVAISTAETGHRHLSVVEPGTSPNLPAEKLEVRARQPFLVNGGFRVAKTDRPLSRKVVVQVTRVTRRGRLIYTTDRAPVVQAEDKGFTYRAQIERLLAPGSYRVEASYMGTVISDDELIVK